MAQAWRPRCARSNVRIFEHGDIAVVNEYWTDVRECVETPTNDHSATAYLEHGAVGSWRRRRLCRENHLGHGDTGGRFPFTSRFWESERPERKNSQRREGFCQEPVELGMNGWGIRCL